MISETTPSPSPGTGPSVRQQRLVFGPQPLDSTIETLRRRLEGFEEQTELAAPTDFPPGE